MGIDPYTIIQVRQSYYRLCTSGYLAFNMLELYTYILNPAKVNVKRGRARERSFHVFADIGQRHESSSP